MEKEPSPNNFCENNSNKKLCEDFFNLNIGCKLLNDIDYITKLNTEEGYDIIFNEKQYGHGEAYVSPDRKDKLLNKKTFVTLYNNQGKTIDDIKLVLVYFHGRGRAQTIRKVISKMSIPFIDIELPAESLWAINYMQPDQRVEFRNCFPNESVPMLYIKHMNDWVTLECYNSSEKILTILSCFAIDNLPIQCPTFNEDQTLIYDLFCVSDKLKDVVYELGYTWKIHDGHYIRVKLPANEAEENLKRWQANKPDPGSKLTLNIDELIKEINIPEPKPPYGYDLKVKDPQNNLQSWIDVWRALTGYINELYISKKINQTEHTNLMLAFEDSLVFLKAQRGINSDAIDFKFNDKELNEIEISDLKFGGRKYRKYRKYRKSRKYRKTFNYISL